jgi:O-antigen ligase
MTTSISNAPDAVVRTDIAPAAELLTPPAPPSDPPSPNEVAVGEVPRTIWSRFIILMLCVAVVTTTLAFGTVHTWALGAFQFTAGLLVVLWMIDAWRTQRLRLSRSLLQLPLVGFIVLGLVQLLPFGSGGTEGITAGALSVEPARAFSFDPYATRLVIIQTAALLVYFASALAFIDTPRRLRLVVRVVVVFGFVLALFGLMQYFLNPYVIYWVKEPKQAQPFGPYINRHHFAGYMELALAMPLGLIFAGAVERDRLPLYAFFSLIMAAALVMTNSRGGMISLAAEVLFLVVIAAAVGRRRGSEEPGTTDLRARVRAMAKRIAFGFALLATLFLFALYSGGEEAISRLVGTVNAADPTTGRAHFWKGTLEIIKDHPVLGTGLGSFSAVYPRYDTANGAYRLEQAHNDYLQILSDGGVIGALLGLVFVVVLLRKGFARLESQDKFRRGVALGALTGCVGVLVHSFFDFTLHTTANGLLFLLLAALATMNGRVEEAAQKRRRRRKKRREETVALPPPSVAHSGE